MFRYAVGFLALVSSIAVAADASAPIDMTGFLQVAAQAAQHRDSHRVGEAEFLRLRDAPGTVVLDARSAQKFAELHVAGAINLSFPDIAEAALAYKLPDKDTLILIYCNNNFRNAEGAFPSKLPSASLNLSTYIALYDYGYRNVYELDALLDPATTNLPMASSAALAR